MPSVACLVLTSEMIVVYDSAGSVSSCWSGFGNKEVADLGKEQIMIFTYTTLFLLSLPFLFFSNFQLPVFLPGDVLSCAYSKAKQLLTDSCILWMSLANQHKQAACKSACPERGVSSPGWSQVQGGILSWYSSLLRRTGEPVMLSCTLYIMPAEPSCIVLPNAGGFLVSLWKHTLQVDLGHQCPDCCLSSLISLGAINCLDFSAVCWMAISWYCTLIILDVILPTWLWM